MKIRNTCAYISGLGSQLNAFILGRDRDPALFKAQHRRQPWWGPPRLHQTALHAHRRSLYRFFVIEASG